MDKKIAKKWTDALRSGELSRFFSLNYEGLL